MARIAYCPRCADKPPEFLRVRKLDLHARDSPSLSSDLRNSRSVYQVDDRERPWTSVVLAVASIGLMVASALFFLMAFQPLSNANFGKGAILILCCLGLMALGLMMRYLEAKIFPVVCSTCGKVISLNWRSLIGLQRRQEPRGTRICVADFRAIGVRRLILLSLSGLAFGVVVGVKLASYADGVRPLLLIGCAFLCVYISLVVSAHVRRNRRVNSELRAVGSSSPGAAVTEPGRADGWLQFILRTSTVLLLLIAGLGLQSLTACYYTVVERGRVEFGLPSRFGRDAAPFIDVYVTVHNSPGGGNQRLQFTYSGAFGVGYSQLSFGKQQEHHIVAEFQVKRGEETYTPVKSLGLRLDGEPVEHNWLIELFARLGEL